MGLAERRASFARGVLAPKSQAAAKAIAIHEYRCIALVSMDDHPAQRTCRESRLDRRPWYLGCVAPSALLLFGTQLEFVAEWKPLRELAFLVSYSQFLPVRSFVRPDPPRRSIFLSSKPSFSFDPECAGCARQETLRRLLWNSDRSGYLLRPFSPPAILYVVSPVVTCISRSTGQRGSCDPVGSARIRLDR